MFISPPYGCLRTTDSFFSAFPIKITYCALNTAQGRLALTRRRSSIEKRIRLPQTVFKCLHSDSILDGQQHIFKTSNEARHPFGTRSARESSSPRAPNLNGYGLRASNLKPLTRKEIRTENDEAEKPKRSLSKGLPEEERWQLQKEALRKKFRNTGWLPRKRLSPAALEGIRAIHAQYPDTYSTPVLAEKFKVSPEAVRRILKSKWRPNEDEDKERQRRWDSRGEKIWSQMVHMGLHPPRRWRGLGINSVGKRRKHGFPTVDRT